MNARLSPASSGFDKFDRSLDALGAIEDLLTQCANTQRGDLQLVNPDRLCRLLALILEELHTARALLTSQVAA